ncbi:gliding motility-associated C-terminal domain-containing protein [Lewinella sp. LCG006]|uniref:DUF6923 family protein n=1 Tax=Lewinella sp. LCG006 TaxID=3231911 RepID=UPI00346167CD
MQSLKLFRLYHQSLFSLLVGMLFCTGFLNPAFAEEIAPPPLVGPFGCTGFQVTYETGVGNFGNINLMGNIDQVGSVGAGTNATGYNSQDGFLYAFRGSDSNLLRLHDDGTIDDLGNLGIPNTSNLVTGGFDESGNYYVKTGADVDVYIVDVNTLTFVTVTPTGLFFAKDWAYHAADGNFYGVHGTDLYTYDPGANSVSIQPLTGIQAGENSVFGATFYAADEHIYVMANNSGNIYRVNVNTLEASYVISIPGLTGTDGASCASASPPFPVVCAHEDEVCVPFAGEAVVDILDNDDAINTSLDFFSFSLLDPPSFGTVSFDDFTGELTYTPNGTAQADQLTYEICGTSTDPVVCDYAVVNLVPGPQITFPAFGPYCEGNPPSSLPSTSPQGISGSWSPGSIDTSTPGTETYTFTPDPDECGYEVSIDVTVDPLEVPTFTLDDTYCEGDAAQSLPGVSDNGISGSWSPAVIDNINSGSYTFTPNPGQCADIFVLDVTIFPGDPSSFSLTDNYCEGETTDVLPSSDDNGVSGSWSPSFIDNQNDGSYTFTPDPGQCASEFILDVTIQPADASSFNINDTYCQGETTDLLPDFDDNGVAGTWFPAIIDNQNSGSYTFTPNDGQCASEFILDVTIQAANASSFNINDTYCQGETTDPLPDFDDNGVAGTWFPAIIDNQNSGSYTFTPNDGQCASEFILDVTIQPADASSFNINDTYCQGETTDPLPDFDDNGVAGTWFPAIIDNQNSGSYTFTPNDGQCASEFILDVTIQPANASSFNINDTYCQGETTEPLPDFDDNGVAGTWFPAIIDNQNSGSYTFTPNDGQCASEFILDVSIQPANASSFNINDTYCQGETTDLLPDFDDNGVAGTWFPAIIDNQNSGSYTFTPDPGQCASEFILDVTIQPANQPTFNLTTLYCQGATTDPLPTTSDNGISGTWSPVTIDNQNSGSYVFTPDGGQCASAFTLDVTIQPANQPTFNLTNLYCQGATTDPLPTTSDNGISGTWSPVTIDNQNSGSYVFTPDGGQCASAFTLDVTIQPANTPTFNLTNLYCQGATTDLLPTSSDNGISGTWSPATIDNQNSATYTFTPDGGQCASAFTLEVTIQPANLPSFNITNLYCQGENTDPLPTSSDNGISGTWSPVTIDNQNSATYTFTPDNGQCASIFTLDVTIANTPSATPTSLRVCSASVNGLFNLRDADSAVSGGEPGVINWYSDSNANTPIADPQNYSSFGGDVFAQIAIGSCLSEIVAVALIVDLEPQATLALTSPLACFGDTDASLVLEIVGEPLNIDWSEDSLDGQQEAFNLGSGTYSVTVTDENTCSTTTSIIIPTPEMLLLDCSATTNPTSVGGNDGQANLLFEGGTAGYTINWAGPVNGSTTLPTEGSFLLDNLSAGVYAITLTDNNGCMAVCSFTLNDPSCDLALELANNDPTCSGSSDGTILLTINSSQTISSIDWNVDAWDGQTYLSGLPAGNYQVTVTDALGCTEMASLVLNNPTALVLNCQVDQHPDQVMASNGSINIVIVSGPGGPYTISYDNGMGSNGSIAGTVGNNLITNLPEGAFQIVVSNGQCTANCAVVLVAGSCTIMIAAEVRDETCTGSQNGSVTLLPTGQAPHLYQWADGNDQATRDGLLPGNYPVTVTDANGCVGNTTVTVAPGAALPTLVVGDFAVDICPESCALIPLAFNGQADFTLNYRLGFANMAQAQQDLFNGDTELEICPSDTAIPPGSFTIILDSLQDANCTSILNDTLTLNYLAPVTEILTATLCPGDSLVINGVVFNAAAPSGEVLFVGGSSAGCDSLVQVALNYYPPALSSIDTTLCAGESLLVGNEVFDAMRPSGTVILPGAAATGCDSTITVSVQFFPALTATLSGDAVLCASESTSLQITTNGNFAFDYIVSENGSPSLAGSAMGTSANVLVSPTITSSYQLESINSNGACPVEIIPSSVTVTVSNPAVSLGINSEFNGFAVSCSNATDGSISAVVTDGTAPFSYSWSNGGNGPELENLGVGNYTLSLTDAAGCMIQQSIALTAPEPIFAEITSIPGACNDENSGQLQIDLISGGAAPYEYSLDGEFFSSLNTTPLAIDGLAAGNYTLYLQDANDCLTEQTTVLPASTTLVLDLGDDQELLLGDSFLLDPFTNFVPASWDWSTTMYLSSPDSFVTYTQPSESIRYFLTMTDSNGCSVQDEIFLRVRRDIDVFVPNVFSPNNDGSNDLLRIFAGSAINSIRQFQIFDRWGNQLYVDGPFSPNDPQYGWNGKFRGEEMNPGVYVYFATVELVDGSLVQIEGDVVLLR